MNITLVFYSKKGSHQIIRYLEVKISISYCFRIVARVLEQLVYLTEDPLVFLPSMETEQYPFHLIAKIHRTD